MQHSATNKHLTSLVDAIHKCGVGFSVWEKPNGDGKGSGHYDWSSLVGGDKDRVLQGLPNNLNGLLPETNCQAMIKVWKVFNYPTTVYLETCSKYFGAFFLLSTHIAVSISQRKTFHTLLKINLRLCFRNLRWCMTL